MSGLGAGCPGWRVKLLDVFCRRCRISGEGPDVRALVRRWMSGAGAGCPAADAVGRLLVQLLGGCTGAGCPAAVASAAPSSSVVASRPPSRMV